MDGGPALLLNLGTVYFNVMTPLMSPCHSCTKAFGRPQLSRDDFARFDADPFPFSAVFRRFDPARKVPNVPDPMAVPDPASNPHSGLDPIRDRN